MPNRFTQIPDGSPPQLPASVGALVPLADLFMILMVSRPATGSLRQTWVTPASLWLGVGTALAMVVIIALALIDFTGTGRVIALVVAAVLLLGSASVAAVGLAQRRSAS